MIRGNVFDVFAVRFADGREISMIAKDADTARALAESFFPEKTIVESWQINPDDHDH
jgi:predicted nuclease with TOPRIM domain